MKKQKKQSSWIKILNTIVFFALIFLTFWLIFKDQDLNQVIHIAFQANGFFLLAAVSLMVLYFAVEAKNIMSLLGSLGERISFLRAFRYTMVGFFFCSVTPGASGGQPLEVYYMSREGVSAPNATLAILIQTCGVQFAVTGFGVLCALFGMHYLSGPVAFLFAIGLVINLAALLILLACVFYTGWLRSILRRVLGFLWGHGVKSADKWQKSLEKSLDKYAESSRYIRSHRSDFRRAMLRAVLQIALFYLVPYCVYLSFGLHEMSIVSFFIMQSILFVSTSGLPIPGAIGASESVFLGLYGAAFGEEMLSSAMLLSRGISFYLFVAVSLVFIARTLLRRP